MNVSKKNIGMTAAMIASLLLLGCLAAFGQDEENVPHRIDVELAKCLKVNKANMPRAKCYSTASEAWEKDVTDTYAKLLKVAKADVKPTVISSQSAWKRYRDAEDAMVSKVYGKRRGTGYISVRIVLISEIRKARALRLESWLQTLNPPE